MQSKLSNPNRRRIWPAVTGITAAVAIVCAAARLAELQGRSQQRARGQRTACHAGVGGHGGQTDVNTWDEFSGRLEAVERVDIRSRVAGAVQVGAFPRRRAGQAGRPADHDRSGALRGRRRSRRSAGRRGPGARDLHAQRAGTRARRLWDEQRDRPARDTTSASTRGSEADANLRAAQAALQTARLSLGYTQVRAPVAGPHRQARDDHRQPGRRRPRRAGADHAGVGEPDLRELRCRRAGRRTRAEGPARRRQRARADRAASRCRWAPPATTARRIEGHLQLIDNQVDAKSGTVRVRAAFDNKDGALMPGQFARIRMGQAAGRHARCWSTSARSAPTRTRSS